MSIQVDKVVSAIEALELVADSEQVSRLDLGHSTIHRLKHPALGSIVVLCSHAGDGALLAL